jgi:probable H4MPT-linked C1 transfer pathway protein
VPRDDAVIGWDLGGAHLKAARLDESGRVLEVVQVPCRLWEGMHHFHSAVDEISAALGPAPIHAVTMTGEMVDFFPSRGEGVARLVTAITERLPGSTVRFYAGRRGFLDPAAALRESGAVASANWVATAALVAARQSPALLVDIGSTTTDLIPVLDGRVRAVGQDDAGRLVTGELVYTGVVRTPVMALAERAPFGGESVPLIAEFFATSADLYRVLERLPEGADQHPAADGGEKTIEASARRLLRMLGRDFDPSQIDACRELAGWLAEAQLLRIRDACNRVRSRALLADDAPYVAAGVGRFLVRDLAARDGRRCIEFGSLVPSAPGVDGAVSDCAPAVAVAWLARQAA